MTAFRATGGMTAAVATVAAIGLLGFAGVATAQQEQQQSPFPDTEGPVNWVTTDWLEQNLNTRDLVIIDTQPDVHDYFAEHIPGAVYLNDTVLRAPENGIPAQYVPEDVIRTLFQRIGVAADQPVVVYTGTGAFTEQTGGLEQTMMAYTLARFGHDDVYLLDGGLDKWRAENRPVTQEFPQVQESSLNTSVQEGMFLTYNEVLEMHGQDNVVLLDARPYDLYAGEGPWIMEGHIPGAVNLPWRDLMAEDNPTLLKPRGEIQAMLDEAGISPDQTIIVSCGTGREATNEYLILSEFMGYPNVVLFEGSFTEWTAHPENETVTGPNPS